MTLTVLLAPGLAAMVATEPPDDALARRACSGCHVVPPADVLPRSQWKKVLYEMAGIIMGNIGAPKGAPPLDFDFDIEQLVQYYESRAPATLPAPESWPSPDPAVSRFVPRLLRLAGEGAQSPRVAAVAAVRFADLEGKGRLKLVAADMGTGLVVAGDPRRPEEGLRILARTGNPCHVEAVDLDRDGRPDLLVANLGGMAPEDHEKGSVVWLRQGPTGGFEVVTLAANLPRVADVEAADVDGDGDLDLLVAAFGWRLVGGILLLENRTRDWTSPQFVPRVIDDRTGAIHVPLTDLDGDGRPDFVALLAQHHESVEAFLNDGGRDFKATALYQAPHPAWGSSGLALADIDGDEDQDVLVTNGDMLDDFLLKPYHGMRWLENLGGLRFREHPLADLPGVMRALAADLDGDGDQDVVACAYVEFKASGGASLSSTDQASLVWLEQQAPGVWKRHTLERGVHHVTLDVADYDKDGDMDVAVGRFRTEGAHLVDLWENRGTKP